MFSPNVSKYSVVQPNHWGVLVIHKRGFIAIHTLALYFFLLAKSSHFTRFAPWQCVSSYSVSIVMLYTKYERHIAFSSQRTLIIITLYGLRTKCIMCVFSSVTTHFNNKIWFYVTILSLSLITNIGCWILFGHKAYIKIW